MNPQQLASEIKKIGREVNMETLGQTRNLYAPLHPVAPFEGVKIHRDIRYGPDDRNRLDLFVPGGGTRGPLPALIYVHGGGFIGGDKYTPGTPFYDNVGVWSVRHGLAGINITHRLAPRHPWPAVIEDIACAMKWLRDNAEKSGIDISHVYLMGQSAGAAHVASYIAHPEIYAPADQGLAGAIFMSGLYNLTTMEADNLMTAYFGDDPSLYSERSSLAGLKQSSVPVMVVLPEHEVGLFESQALEVLAALKERDSHLPRFIHLIGHNHLSGILHLGLEGDLLGPRLIEFINDNP